MGEGDNRIATKEYVRFVAEEVAPIAMNLSEIDKISKTDPDLENIRNCLWPMVRTEQ